jgi:amino-acid N-acetyltransferase
MIQRPALSAVKELLQQCDLPASDLTDAHLEHFFARASGEALEGIVGLELHKPVALLRSLAVATKAREQGLGSALLAEAERYARSQGVTEIYLLTTTAERFFALSGYERVQRETAPKAIRETQEFSRLCPASAAVMRKRL